MEDTLTKTPRPLNLAEMLEKGPETASACRTLAAIELRNQHALIDLLVETLKFYQRGIMKQTSGGVYFSHGLSLDGGDRIETALAVVSEYHQS